MDTKHEGFNICNSWVGLAATMVIGMEQGGSITVVYGLLVVLFFLGCSALTMAELASVYPTAGGPYHWTSILAPGYCSRVLSYISASFNIFGWLSITSGVAVQPGQFIQAVRIFFDPDVDVPVLVILSITSFLVIIITCLSRASSFNSSEFVWTTFINNTGWKSNGVVFLTGLANPNFMFAGIDGAVHLAEEVVDAGKFIPRALMSTVVIGFMTAFGFSLSMLYTLSDFDKVTKSLTEVPIYEIWYQATRSQAAATVFIFILLSVALFALNACLESSSRLTWSFARDNALLGSQFLGKIHPLLQVPVWAPVANGTVIFIIGCIYLGSFALPAGLLLWHGRSESVLPMSRGFNLRAFGWIANAATLVFAPLITVVYCFPVGLPVTGSSMNYTVCVVGVMALFSATNWFLHARHYYRGPRLPAM
ncbi:amino acid permease-domain-containing protein [Aspergillus aurantiobrunneus]